MYLSYQVNRTKSDVSLLYYPYWVHDHSHYRGRSRHRSGSDHSDRSRSSSSSCGSHHSKGSYNSQVDNTLRRMTTQLDTLLQKMNETKLCKPQD